MTSTVQYIGGWYGGNKVGGRSKGEHTSDKNRQADIWVR